MRIFLNASDDFAREKNKSFFNSISIDDIAPYLNAILHINPNVYEPNQRGCVRTFKNDEDYFKNKDYIGLKVHLDMFGPSVLADLPNNVCVQSLNITKLCEAYEEGKLSGKLKDIAANLKEDDNPVLMIIKFRE